MNDKSVEGLCEVLRSPGGTTGVVSNPEVAVSEMVEANVHGIIYYIKHFKKIGRTCTHADVDLSKVRDMHHQWDMEEFHKDPIVVPTVDSKGMAQDLGNSGKVYNNILWSIWTTPQLWVKRGFDRSGCSK